MHVIHDNIWAFKFLNFKNLVQGIEYTINIKITPYISKLTSLPLFMLILHKNSN